MKKNFLSGLLLATMLGSATSAWADKYTYTYRCNGEVVAYYESEGERSELISSNAIIWGTGKFQGHKYFLTSFSAKGPNFDLPVVESKYSYFWIPEVYDKQETVYEVQWLSQHNIYDTRDTVSWSAYKKYNGVYCRYASSTNKKPMYSFTIGNFENQQDLGLVDYDKLPAKGTFVTEDYIYDNYEPVATDYGGAVLTYTSTDENGDPLNDKILFFGEAEDPQYGGQKFIWNGYYANDIRIKSRNNGWNQHYYSGGYEGILKNDGKYSLGTYPAGSYSVKIVRPHVITKTDLSNGDDENRGYARDYVEYQPNPLCVYHTGATEPDGEVWANRKIDGESGIKEEEVSVNLDTQAEIYIKGDNIPFDYVVVEKNWEEVPVRDYGYSTYSSGNALDFSKCASEVEVYRAALVDTNEDEKIKTRGFQKKVVFEDVTGQVIPANTGILLRSKSGKAVTVHASITSESVKQWSDNYNYLMPIVTKSTIYAMEERNRTDYRNYLLNKQVVEDDNGNEVERVNFYRIPWGKDPKRNYYTARAHTAYLSIPYEYVTQTSGEGIKSIELQFDNGEVTGIVNVSETTSTAQKGVNDAIYNLSGQRVDSSYKGIVIRNGKKYLVK